MTVGQEDNGAGCVAPDWGNVTPDVASQGGTK